MGAAAPRLVYRHLIPNALSVVIVNITFQVADSILALAYLGLPRLRPAVPGGVVGRHARQRPDTNVIERLLVARLPGRGLPGGGRDGVQPGRRRAARRASTCGCGAAERCGDGTMPRALEVTNLTHAHQAVALDRPGGRQRRPRDRRRARRSGWSASRAAASRCSASRSSACCRNGGQIVEGSVKLDGRELVGLPDSELRRLRGNEVAMIFQDSQSSLNPTKTIGEQVAEPVRLHRGASRAEATERALEVLELVGLPQPRERLGDYPHQLSGGLRQRVMIAIALACEPKVLLADEPTTALDVTIQAQILALLDDLERPPRDGDAARHPRHGRRRRPHRPDQRHVRRADRRDGARPSELFSAHAPPVHAGAARARSRGSSQDNRKALVSIPGLPARPDRPARRLPLRPALPARHRAVPRARSRR